MFRASKTDRIDREALSALYHATKGSEWLNNVGWLSNIKLQNWNGVEVNASGRVVSLHLGGGEGASKFFRPFTTTLRYETAAVVIVINVRCQGTSIRILYGHTYSKGKDQPGEIIANPARGQLNRENEHYNTLNTAVVSMLLSLN